MTIVAQISGEGESTDLNQVLADSNENLTIREHLDHSAHSQQIVEIGTDDKNSLLRFYDECMNRGVSLAVHRIYHEPDEASHPSSEQTNRAA